MAEKILIYRLGSLGDTVVALPCFHLIRRAFPSAEIRVLTNQPVSPNAPRLSSVLAGTDLADGYFEYPIRTKDIGALRSLGRSIRAWGPDKIVYLTLRGRRLTVLRDLAFFALFCGVRRFIGAPFRRDLLEFRALPNGLSERECERLSRCLSRLGDAHPEDPRNWDLQLTADEKAAAERIVTTQIAPAPFIALCVGTNWPANDWGDANWHRVTRDLLNRHAHKIVFVGGNAERARADALTAMDPGRFVNLCGRLAVRETASVLARAALYVGHDTGPMHLAAAVGTPIVALFGNRSKPGIWFPMGGRSRILYRDSPTASVSMIEPDEVVDAVADLLAPPAADKADSAQRRRAVT